MSVKALYFDVSAAGSFDGSTSFSLPTSLVPGATGQYSIPITTASGLLDPNSVELLMGSKGYWLRSAAISIAGNANVIRAMLAITQPKPSISVGGNAISHPIFIQTTNADIDAQPPVRRGPFVPPGWILQFLCDDGAGTPIVGPYTLAVELETLPLPADAARAIRSQDFPGYPVTIA